MLFQRSLSREVQKELWKEAIWCKFNLIFKALMFNFWLILINCKVADIVIAEETNRPDGAPPTYDDAMKFVNDAFENNEVKI